MTGIYSRHRLATALASGLLLVGLGMQPVSAQSICQGLEKSPCEAKDACHWVDGYTRKDGVKVSSHCRKSPTRKDSKSVSSDSSDSRPVTK